MANIQIVGNILQTTNVSRYSSQDTNLLSSQNLSDGFGLPGDFIENYVFDAGGTLLNIDYNYKNYKLPSGSFLNPLSSSLPLIEIDPIADLQSLGYNNGEFNTQYNFFRNKIGSVNSQLYLSEISSDRTEIRVTSTTIANSDLSSSVNLLISQSTANNFYTDYLVNFGSNQQVVAVNIALDTSDSNQFSVLFKLYQPLPPQFQVKNTLWVVEEILSPYIFDINLSKFILPDPLPSLRGPNFSIDVQTHNTVPTSYQTLNSLVNYNQPNSSSFGQILNYLNNSGSVQINVDYTDFSNFVNFSAAKVRLENFYTKVKGIEDANNFITTYSPFALTTASLQGTINLLSSSIQNTITNFDPYEYYLYFQSGTFAWPKVSSSLPYALQSTGSTESMNWYTNTTSSAEAYDLDNQNNLQYITPVYIQEDPSYLQYIGFVNMIGQYFDSIWVYLKSVTDLYVNNNNLNIGVSKDLVYSALESLGINLYNSEGDEDFFNYIIGANSGSVSDTSNIPLKDVVTETYKRIYHNLPYLIKSKGTRQGLRALISCFGIPDTIIRINEFGGNDKSNTTLDQIYNRFSYAIDFASKGSIKTPWLPLTQNAHKILKSDVVADSIEFRFKLYDNYNTPSQSLFEVTNDGGSTQFGIQILQTGSFGKMAFAINGPGGIRKSPAITFPLTGSDYTDPWWSVLLRRETGSLDQFQTGSNQTYTLFLKDSANNGTLGFQYSSSLFISSSDSAYNFSWNNYSPSVSVSSSYFGYLGGQNLNSTLAPAGTFLSGSAQEFRYWSTVLSESAFNIHVLNPLSYEEDNPTASFYDLAFKLSLGNDLLTASLTNNYAISSSHPDQSISSSFIGTVLGSIYGLSLYGVGRYGFALSGSFVSTGFAEGFPLVTGSGGNFIGGTEHYYVNAPDSGISVRTTEKIRIISNPITGSVLSPLLKLEEQPLIPLTNDNQYLDVSFSPINEINDDIINQLGGFSFDNYVGDPHDLYSTDYNALTTLKNFYFGKYLRKYNYYDYIRLIQFFDNSLFKMIADFVPARTNLSTGISFQSPILERNKIKNTKVSSSVDTGSLAKYSSSRIEADTSYIYPFVGGDKSAFFTGQFSGSEIDIYKHYFIPNNHNPYLYITSSGNSGYFYNSDFNAYLNNVSSSRLSLIRQRIEQQPYSNLVVSSSAELQDSYLSLRSYELSRHDGVKATSLIYNTYTTASGAYPGDSSYGQTAAVDLNTIKFAWIKQISPTNLNFFDKTSIIIKYLVDGSGSLTELSRHNNNIFEVQNIFKSGTPTVVSLSDLVHPSPQYSLDGDKMIFEGGFSYSPLIFRESDEPLDYTYLIPLVNSSSVSANVIQQKSFQYDTNQKPQNTRTPDIDTSLGGYVMTYGGVIQTTGKYASSNTIPVTNWPYFSQGNIFESNQVNITQFNIGAPGNYSIDSNTNNFVYQLNPDFITFNDFVSINDTFTQYVQLNDGSYALKLARNSTYSIKVDVPFNIGINEIGPPGASIIKVLAIIEKNTDPNGAGTWQFVDNSSFSYWEITGGQVGINPTRSLIYLDQNTYNGGPGGSQLPFKVQCSINGNYNLNAGDYIRFSFFVVRLNNFFPPNNEVFMSIENRFVTPPTAIQDGTINVIDTVNNITSVLTTGSYQANDLFVVTGANNNVLQFTDAGSLLWGKVIFTPSSSSISEPLYSPISFPFTIQTGDIVRLSSYFTYNPTYYLVTSVTPPVTGSGGVVFSDLTVTLDKSVGASPVAISSNFVIFRRLPDETSVILNFNKAPGATSQALLIPYDLDSDVKANVANIASKLAPSLNSTVNTTTITS